MRTGRGFAATGMTHSKAFNLRGPGGYDMEALAVGCQEVLDAAYLRALQDRILAQDPERSPPSSGAGGGQPFSVDAHSYGTFPGHQSSGDALSSSLKVSGIRAGESAALCSPLRTPMAPRLRPTIVRLAYPRALHRST